jgi:DNA-binding transcriptional MerR regulator
LDKAADAFRTISEVAEELDVPQHVLRFWESRFAQIKPMKRGGGRRYYRPEDVGLLHGIRHLLYVEGYTIRGVQGILRDKGIRFVQTVWQEGAEQAPHRPDLDEPEGDGIGGEDRGEAAVRREPPMTSAPVPRVNPSERPMAPPLRPALSGEGVRQLQSVLRELAECRRLIGAALEKGG